MDVSHSTRLASPPNVLHPEQPRKRVCKACDRCRLKKSKCDGSEPCSRCQDDNAICIYGARRKTRDKVYPKGYVEMLEEQQGWLIYGLQELYQRITDGRRWDGQYIQSEANGYPLTHDILTHLGAFDHINSERSRENLKVMQSLDFSDDSSDEALPFDHSGTSVDEFHSHQESGPSTTLSAHSMLPHASESKTEPSISSTLTPEYPSAMSMQSVDSDAPVLQLDQQRQPSELQVDCNPPNPFHTSTTAWYANYDIDDIILSATLDSSMPTNSIQLSDYDFCDLFPN